MGKGRTPCCEKGRVKKGPWSQDEDLKLISFIDRHGHSNWRSLPKLAGLVRCGKSCRLRWVNYLRPDVKRGRLTPDEEETIIRLQSLIGNKWSKIASHLPGRTDNEIKNIWNTHLKRRLIDKKPDKTFTKSAQHDQDKVSDEPSSYVQINGQAGPTPSITPKDDGTIEFSSSDCTTRDTNHVPIDVTRKISHANEPNLVDLWESLLLDAGSQYDQLNPNIHDSIGKQSLYVVPKVDTLVNKKDMQARGNSLCPFGLLNNVELEKINEETITATNYGGYQEIVDEQMSKTYQLEAISNDELLKMDNNMEIYLEIIAWPSSPTCYSFSGF